VNGAQDVGGMQSFGPVLPEADEPVFHARWEERVMALSMALGGSGMWNADMTRAARESLPPAEYWSVSYYEIWLRALEKLTVAKGLLSKAELDCGKPLIPPISVPRRLDVQTLAIALAKGSPVTRPAPGAARFKAGDRVRTREINIPTHTRLPRYCRDKRGEVIRQHGVHVFPDANALGKGEQPQWLYSVRFETTELWGHVCAGSCSVYVDCWESYLDAE
jgi:nitrile hydratase subunit beta